MFLPRKVRANPRKTHGPSPIFQPNCKAAKKSMGIPRRAIIKSETLGKKKRYRKHSEIDQRAIREHMESNPRAIQKQSEY